MTKNVAEPADVKTLPPGVCAYLEGNPIIGVTAIGDQRHLHRPSLGLISSVKCPGNVILDTYDLARVLRDSGVPTVSGFHSPMEKECLDLLLRGTQPIIICPARGLAGMRIPAAWKAPLNDGRLLMLSPFRPDFRRLTKDVAQRRNEFVAAVAATVFIAYAAPRSRTLRLCRKLFEIGESVWTFDRTENSALIELGATAVPVKEVAKRFREVQQEGGD